MHSAPIRFTRPPRGPTTGAGYSSRSATGSTWRARLSAWTIRPRPPARSSVAAMPQTTCCTARAVDPAAVTPLSRRGLLPQRVVGALAVGLPVQHGEPPGVRESPPLVDFGDGRGACCRRDQLLMSAAEPDTAHVLGRCGVELAAEQVLDRPGRQMHRGCDIVDADVVRGVAVNERHCLLERFGQREVA